MGEKVEIIQVDEPQPWVKRLRGQDRVGYDEVRAESIAEQTEWFSERLRRLVNAEDVEAHLGELAAKLAVFNRDTFEAGIQAGQIDADRRFAREREASASFQRNVVGNWAG